MARRGLGFIADPFSPTDPDVDTLGLTRLPETRLLIDYPLPILDQGGANSCVTNGGFAAMRRRLYIQRHMAAAGVTADDLPLDGAHFAALVNMVGDATQGTLPEIPDLGARLPQYRLCLDQDKSEGDPGTFSRRFYRTINDVGFAREKHFPYDPSKVSAPMPTKWFREAYDQRTLRRDPLRYWRLAKQGEALVRQSKLCVAAGIPVTFGTDVSNDFVDGNFDPNESLNPPNRASVAGGHLLQIVGYHQDNFLIESTYSDEWGAGGRCWFSADYLAWKRSRSFWAVEHVPEFSGV